jgi:hypothetical protein
MGCGVRQFSRSNSSPQPKAIETETGKARGGTLVTLSLTLSSGMLGKMWEIEQLAGLDSPDSTPESICACVAKIFHVRETEVGLLELGGRLLNFLYPAELRTAGAIPLSSSAVAARTARTKQAELFNDFTQVKHFSIFELVKLGDTGLDEVIQKLMSAPVLAKNGDVIGVIQVSSKAPRPAAAGPDFTPDDLRKLESVARFVGRLMAKGKGIAQASSV